MPSLSNDEVEISAVVPRELAEEFKSLFPFHGVNRWFITAAMEEIVKQARARDDVREIVRAGVREMLTSN